VSRLRADGCGLCDLRGPGVATCTHSCLLLRSPNMRSVGMIRKIQIKAHI